MKKQLVSALIAATLGLLGTNALADTAGLGFVVKATISSKCRTLTTTAADINFGIYTAFSGPATSSPTTSIAFECTRNFAPTSVDLDTPAIGQLVGVPYSLSVGTAVVTSGGANGSAIRTYTITGSMTPNEAGDATANTTESRTLTLTF